jgi:hypothetical protein
MHPATDHVALIDQTLRSQAFEKELNALLKSM